MFTVSNTFVFAEGSSSSSSENKKRKRSTEEKLFEANSSIEKRIKRDLDKKISSALKDFTFITHKEGYGMLEGDILALAQDITDMIASNINFHEINNFSKNKLASLHKKYRRFYRNRVRQFPHEFLDSQKEMIEKKFHITKGVKKVSPEDIEDLNKSVENHRIEALRYAKAKKRKEEKRSTATEVVSNSASDLGAAVPEVPASTLSERMRSRLEELKRLRKEAMYSIYERKENGVLVLLPLGRGKRETKVDLAHKLEEKTEKIMRAYDKKWKNLALHERLEIINEGISALELAKQLIEHGLDTRITFEHKRDERKLSVFLAKLLAEKEEILEANIKELKKIANPSEELLYKISQLKMELTKARARIISLSKKTLGACTKINKGFSVDVSQMEDKLDILEGLLYGMKAIKRKGRVNSGLFALADKLFKQAESMARDPRGKRTDEEKFDEFLNDTKFLQEINSLK